MVFVLEEPEWHTVPEALRRLWRRNRPDAIVTVLAVSLVASVALVLAVGAPVAGVYLVAAGGLAPIILGVVLTLSGPFLARRFLTTYRPRVGRLAWLLVEADIAADVDNVAPLTGYEREACVALQQELHGLKAAAIRTAEDGSWERMRPLRESWDRQTRVEGAALSRSNNVLGRFEMLQLLLIDGGQQPSEAVTFAEAIVVIAEEADEAIANLLDGRAVVAGGMTWPAYYKQHREEDRINHAGEPVSLAEMLEARARER